MLSFQIMFGNLDIYRRPKPLDKTTNSAITLTKPDYPYPEPEKTKHYTTVLLIFLTFVIVTGSLMFAKKPSIEPLLMIIVGGALAVLVIRIFKKLTK